MAEGTYEYECMRAELLGIEKPDFETFENNRKQRNEVEVEEQEVENLKQAEEEKEELKGIAGKLSELNSLLASTQKKINRFKGFQNTAANLFSILKPSTPKPERKLEQTESTPAEPKDENKSHPEGSSHGNERQSDLGRALDGNLSRLDSLISKAETAEISMHEQRKQMTGFLKK